MATVICPNCGGGNDSTNIGKECDYCGTLLGVSQRLRANHIQSAKKQKQIWVGEVSITAKEALERVKNSIPKELEEVSQNKLYKKYWEVIKPISEQINLLEYEVRLDHIPVFLFKGKCKKRHNYGTNNFSDFIDYYSYTIFAGEDVNYSYSLKNCVDYMPSSRFLRFDICLSSNFSESLFIKDPHKCWYSVKGREMRKDLLDFDGPDIEYWMLPLFSVKVSIGEVSHDIIVKSDGNICNIEEIIYLIAENKLGKEYISILSKKELESFKRNEDEEERRRNIKELIELKGIKWQIIGLLIAFIIGNIIQFLFRGGIPELIVIFSIGTILFELVFILSCWGAKSMAEEDYKRFYNFFSKDEVLVKRYTKAQSRVKSWIILSLIIILISVFNLFYVFYSL